MPRSNEVGTGVTVDVSVCVGTTEGSLEAGVDVGSETIVRMGNVADVVEGEY